LLLPRWLDPAAFCQPKTHSLYRRVWRYDSIKNSGSGATTVLHSLRRYGNTAELQGDTSILYDPLTRAKDLPYLLQQKVISAKRIICHALGLTTKKNTSDEQKGALNTRCIACPCLFLFTRLQRRPAIPTINKTKKLCIHKHRPQGHTNDGERMASAPQGQSPPFWLRMFSFYSPKQKIEKLDRTIKNNPLKELRFLVS
jgi:hypothetical protein